MILRLAPTLPIGTSAMRWFVPTEQPVRRDFGVRQIANHRGIVEVDQHDLALWPFCALTEFRVAGQGRGRILLVAPLSGHFPFLLRELVNGLVAKSDIAVTDWLNARFVPLGAGDFGFD